MDVDNRGSTGPTSASSRLRSVDGQCSGFSSRNSNKFSKKSITAVWRPTPHSTPADPRCTRPRAYVRSMFENKHQGRIIPKHSPKILAEYGAAVAQDSAPRIVRSSMIRPRRRWLRTVDAGMSSATAISGLDSSSQYVSSRAAWISSGSACKADKS